jgi:protein-tyrosine phosphatase
MYKINDRLAVHGFDFNPDTYELKVNYEYDISNYGYISSKKHNHTGKFLDDVSHHFCWKIMDCRDLFDDAYNREYRYQRKISQAIEYLEDNRHVVCCCSAGQSRSNAIALGILIEYFKMDYYDALDLIEEKNPICNIAMQHLDAIKKLYNVRKIP